MRVGGHDLEHQAVGQEGPQKPLEPIQTAAGLQEAPITLDSPAREEFLGCIKALGELDASLTPVEYRDHKEALMQQALVAVAAMHGSAPLKLPLVPDVNGEVMLIAKNPDGFNEKTHGCGHFGEFSALLTPHQPRTGEKPGAIMIPQNGWCWLNHHAIEKIVMGEAARLGAAPAPEPVRPKYTAPVWVDHDQTGYMFRGAKPTWEIDGKTFCGPTLVPEIMTPRTATETKQAKAVLFQLWHWATLAAAGTNAHGHYLGVDEQGRHRIA